MVKSKNTRVKETGRLLFHGNYFMKMFNFWRGIDSLHRQGMPVTIGFFKMPSENDGSGEAHE